MGLAASQARLLSITQRLSDNELRAQLINNQKMRLSAESSQVSENYINALNKTNLMFANYDSADNAQTVPLTFNNMTAFNQYNNQYGLTNAAGNILITEDQAKLYQQTKEAYKNGKAKSAEDEFLRLNGIEYTTSYWGKVSDQLADAGIDFTAAQLREMYEGNAVATPPINSYAETVKTQSYTDFSGYLDDFMKAKANYDNAVNKATQAYINSIGDMQFTISGVGTLSLNTIGDGDNPLKLLQGSGSSKYAGLIALIREVYKETTGTASYPSTVQSYLENDFPITVTGSGNDNFLYTGDASDVNLSSSSALYGGLTKTTYTDVPDTTPQQQTVESFICIGVVDKTEDGEDILGYLKIGSGTRTENPGTSPKTYTYGAFTSDPSTDKTIYTYDGSKMTQITPTDGGATSVNSKKYNATTGKLTYEVTETRTDKDDNVIGSGKRTVTMEFPPLNNDKLSGKTAPASSDKVGTGFKYSSTGADDKENNKIAMYEFVQEALEELLKVIFADLKDTVAANYDPTTFTSEDTALQEKIHNALTTCINIGQYLSNTMFGNGVYTVNQNNMTSFYDYVIQVVNGDGKKADGTFKDCDGHIPVKEFGDVVNAYILDSVMDIFGEPVYTYLYTDGLVNKIEDDGAVNFSTGNIQERNGSSDAQVQARWLLNLFNKIETSGYQVIAKGLANSTEWLQFALENGIVVMEQVTPNNGWMGITYTSCSDISEQTAKTEATLAEAEYNKAMRQIEAKDERLDLELKNIDTEHSSLQNEYESVKKAMSGNIERNFQMYG